MSRSMAIAPAALLLILSGCLGTQLPSDNSNGDGTLTISPGQYTGTATSTVNVQGTGYFAISPIQKTATASLNVIIGSGGELTIDGNAFTVGAVVHLQAAGVDVAQTITQVTPAADTLTVSYTAAISFSGISVPLNGSGQIVITATDANTLRYQESTTMSYSIPGGSFNATLTNEATLTRPG
jgi:hypothetical protein